VRLSITKKEASASGATTASHVVNKGLLGDKMIELTSGRRDASPRRPATLIPSEEPADVFAAAKVVGRSREQTIEKLEPLAQSLGDPKLSRTSRARRGTSTRCSTRWCTATGRCTASSSTSGKADRIDELLAQRTARPTAWTTFSPT
jgi:phospholipid/cholesterol/gamma-HCH transport system substrate-binding protein